MDSSKSQIKKGIISLNLFKNSSIKELASQSKEKFDSQSKTTYIHNSTSSECFIKNDPKQNTIEEELPEEELPKEEPDIILEDSSIQESMSDTSSNTDYEFTQRSTIKQQIKKTTIYRPSEETWEKNVEHIEDNDSSKRRSESSNCYTAASTSVPKKPRVCKANPQRKFTKNKNRMNSYKFQMEKETISVDLTEDLFKKDLASVSEEAYNLSSFSEQINKTDLTTPTPTTSNLLTLNPTGGWKNFKEQCIFLNEMKNEYLINGVKVIFPMEPYNAQKFVMEIVS
ncbi:hypothetical protein M0802_009571 [Mischocyttarus mexicanus]|nr:hypothetical protein M0802_009571 [Mischocyttarus mexicanus]